MTTFVTNPNDGNTFRRSRRCSCSHLQLVPTALHGAQADAEDQGCRKAAVVDEPSTPGVSVVTVQGQVCCSESREENWTEVDLQGHGLDSTVHTQVTFSCRKPNRPRSH